MLAVLPDDDATVRFCQIDITVGPTSALEILRPMLTKMSMVCSCFVAGLLLSEVDVSLWPHGVQWGMLV